MTLLPCPCCGGPAVRRATDPTEIEVLRGAVIALARGHTLEELRTKYRETYAFIHPAIPAMMDALADETKLLARLSVLQGRKP